VTPSPSDDKSSETGAVGGRDALKLRRRDVDLARHAQVSFVSGSRKRARGDFSSQDTFMKVTADAKCFFSFTSAASFSPL